LVTLVLSSFFLGGTLETVEALVVAGVVLVIQIPVTILAMYVLASLLGISYGNLGSAMLKLAAISIFVEGLAFAGTLLGFPLLSRFLLVPVSWFLLSWLFDLDFVETFYSILGLGIIGGAINWLLLMILSGLLRGPAV
jgi:hypothetical protein